MANPKNIQNEEDLKAAINELERKVQFHKDEIKGNYQLLKHELNPKKVVKNTFSYVAETPEIQRTLVNTALGFILGYASKKAVEVLNENSLNRTVENIVSHQLTELENKNPNSLLSKGISLFRRHTPPNSPIYPLLRYRNS
jgi:predicted nuclease with TOPRIM domain